MLKRLILIAVVTLSLVGFTSAQGDLVSASQPALTYIEENLDDVAIYCIDENAPDSNIQHQVDVRFPLASTYKLVILAEMAHQLDLGTFDPNERIALSELDVYVMGIDNAHTAWLATLEEDTESVTLQEIANGMIQHSSNANADFLLRYLGTDNFPTLYEMMGVENTDLPQNTFLGLFLLYNNHETGIFDLESDLSTQELSAEMLRLEEAYTNSATWHEDLNQYWLDYAGDAQLEELIEEQSAFFAIYGPFGTATDMIRILDTINAEDTIFSDEARQFLDETLGWLFTVNPANRDVYEVLSFKGGSLSGVLTSAWYIDPIGLAPYRLAVFYRDMPTETWLNWQTTLPEQILELRVFALGEGCAPFAEIFTDD